jgi:hypothetical protein
MPKVKPPQQHIMLFPTALQFTALTAFALSHSYFRFDNGRPDLKRPSYGWLRNAS